MARWYIIHAYSGFENKVKESILSEAERMGLSQLVEQVEVPTETVTEVKRGKKVQVERKFMPGYVDPHLVNGRGALVHDLVNRARGGDGVEAGCGAEAGSVGIDPDARHLLLFAHDDGLVGAFQHHEDVGGFLRLLAAGVDDRAEQQQVGAGEAILDLHLAL